MTERERQAMRNTILRAEVAERDDWFLGVIEASFSLEECTALRRQANKRLVLARLRNWARTWAA
ncbi:MAG TPA: hypothetical protein VGG75_13595 [Trebonia sp.]|jgi:hypothetical protein